MLRAEREQVALQVMGQFAAIARATAESDTPYLDQLRAKIELLLNTVDVLACQAGDPLLVKDALPGYDILVFRATDSEPVELDVSESASTALDPRHVEGLTLLMDRAFDGRGDGVFLHESSDGINYMVFRSALRAQTLADIGFDATETLRTADIAVETKTVH